ncbi:butyrophilin subfamily 1 member A1 isoform X2 [Hyaena hyaena]|uniref:butyrophilin subfamily 1 member A1 isoform X2 n=1 Tax=Hyaena hyaena TaxID=95912 RepID=UPI001920B879|nr:butyrophilin subfamily 1 member A1 isoform X2 [Hyaena hyaena]
MAAFPNSCLPACLLVLTLVRLSRPDSAPLDVVGPAEPVVAALGGDAELPCSLSASASAERMELRWYRGRRAAAVLVRRDGRARDAEQAAEFRGRATLLDGGLAAGRAAVRLHRVRASDDGEYRCLFRQDGRYGEASVHLKVAASFFPRLTPWMVAVAVILMVLGLLTIGSIFCTWRLYRERSRQRENEFSSTEKLLDELKWKKATLHAVDVTLDPDTAHPHLFLFEDSKSVRLEDSRQQLPEKPERFDSWPCVLGRETFTSGRHFWEVKVGDRADWAVGVCRENVVKKGFDPMTPENGFWAVELYGNGYWALTPQRTPLPLAGPPQRVGIFLDYESGDVSFYNMASGAHIYTFSDASFSGPLRPFFCLWSCGKKPLTICASADRPDKVTVVVDAKDFAKEIPLSAMGEDPASGDAGTLHSKLIPTQPSHGAL